MSYPPPSRAGFSMVEIIVVLLLIGLLSVLTAPIFAKVLHGTVAGAVEQQTAEEAYWATSRMVTLLGLAVTAEAPTPQQLTIELYDSAADATVPHIFAFNNNQITYDNVLFWDQVQSFEVRYAAPLFEIEIQLVDASHPIIALDVFARNTR